MPAYIILFEHIVRLDLVSMWEALDETALCDTAAFRQLGMV